MLLLKSTILDFRRILSFVRENKNVGVEARGWEDIGGDDGIYPLVGDEGFITKLFFKDAGLECGKIEEGEPRM